jgi:putative ABC transport system substrate-binding protein
MRRRDFLKVIAGGVATRPLVAQAQQTERMRRIGVLVPADDTRFRTFIGAFQQELQSLGWSIGRNVRIEMRASASSASAARKYAAELVGFAPDVILAAGGSTVAPLLEATHAIPIVFTITADPVGNGFVDSLGRPGGNATGFMSFEYSMAAKWLELLKQIAPGVTRVAVLRDAGNPSGNALFSVIQAMAPSLRVEVTPASMRDAGEIERFLAAFARTPNGGLIVTTSGSAYIYRDLIVMIATRHKLPTVYYEHVFVAAGGLMSYGPDFVEQHRQAAHYVDRVLKGEKPAELPVQAPTKFELAINLKTAKTLGLTVPPQLLASASEVIE